MGLFALFLAHTFALSFFPPRKKKVSQEDQRIRIHHADVLFHDAATTGDGQVLKGNVLMTHAASPHLRQAPFSMKPPILSWLMGSAFHTG